MRIIIMHDWSALMRKHVLITGAVALIGISVSPVQAEVLRYHCTSGDLSVDTVKQTITGTGSGNGEAVPAKIDKRNIYWTDNDGDQHYMDRRGEPGYYLNAGKWIRMTDSCSLMR